MKTFKIVDLFCGVGGLSYGFYHDKHFKITVANDINKVACEAYIKNHPGVKIVCDDIKKFNINNTVDIVLGGPPCQSFSTVGKRLVDDPRGQLFKEYYRLLSDCSPELFIFENVKGLTTIQKGIVFTNIIELFESLGYHISFQILNAVDYNTPQFRERVFIVGSKKPRFMFPDPITQQYITIKDALSDLPLIESGEVGVDYISEPQNEYQYLMRMGSPKQILYHDAPKHNNKLIELMKNLPDGGTQKDLPVHLKPTSGFNNSYSRLWWNKPSSTITSNLGTPSSSRCIHPINNRALTTREGARLQGFPDNFIFCGSRSEKNLQIGNSVPPQVSVSLKDAVLKYFELSS